MENPCRNDDSMLLFIEWSKWYNLFLSNVNHLISAWFRNHSHHEIIQFQVADEQQTEKLCIFFVHSLVSFLLLVDFHSSLLFQLSFWLYNILIWHTNYVHDPFGYVQATKQWHLRIYCCFFFCTHYRLELSTYISSFCHNIATDVFHTWMRRNRSEYWP